MRKESIVYLNYFPYENSGHILEYLLENFEKVYLFSIAFHTLGNKSINKFSIYKYGKLIKDEYLFCITIPKSLVFFFIPIRSLINFAQIIAKLISIKRQFGAIDAFFTVNAFTASIGRILKTLHVVGKTVFWVWDYYPTSHPSILARVLRRLYWEFDKFATYSDRVVYLHSRLAKVRKDADIIDRKKSIVVPIGTGKLLPIKKKDFHDIKIGFIGVLKRSQGLGMLIDSASVLSKHFKNLSFEIIGSGPDEKFFKQNTKTYPNIRYNFYGLVSEEKFKDILYNCTIGIAPYTPEEGTVSKYTDPGKPKRYIEFNLPVIATDIIGIAKELKNSGAGEIIKYNDPEDLVRAIRKIVKNYERYTKNVRELNKKYYYKDIYPAIFGFTQ